MDADPEPSQSTEFSKIYEPAICPFCFNSEFYKGTDWSPTKCLYCGAIYIFGEWLSDG